MWLITYLLAPGIANFCIIAFVLVIAIVSLLNGNVGPSAAFFAVALALIVAVIRNPRREDVGKNEQEA